MERRGLVSVLVCGSNYGRMYVRAVQLNAKSYCLAGVLASGSVRSRELATNLCVPLYRSVSELPPDIDVACFALPGAAFDVAVELLRRGIHVICEHPRTSAEVQTALAVAASHGVCFHVNGHFTELPAARAFISESREVHGSGNAILARVLTTDRALYGIVDILCAALPAFDECDIAAALHSGPFVVLNGRFGSLLVVFHVQSGRTGAAAALPDGSPDYLADLRVELIFETGILSLLSFAGPVIWNANYHRTSGGNQPLTHTVFAQDGITAATVHFDRVFANLASLDDLMKHVRQGVAPSRQSRESLLRVSRVWESLSAAL